MFEKYSRQMMAIFLLGSIVSRGHADGQGAASIQQASPSVNVLTIDSKETAINFVQGLLLPSRDGTSFKEEVDGIDQKMAQAFAGLGIQTEWLAELTGAGVWKVVRQQSGYNIQGQPMSSSMGFIIDSNRKVIRPTNIKTLLFCSPNGEGHYWDSYLTKRNLMETPMDQEINGLPWFPLLRSADGKTRIGTLVGVKQGKKK